MGDVPLVSKALTSYHWHDCSFMNAKTNWIKLNITFDLNLAEHKDSFSWVNHCQMHCLIDILHIYKILVIIHRNITPCSCKAFCNTILSIKWNSHFFKYGKILAKTLRKSWRARSLDHSQPTLGSCFSKQKLFHFFRALVLLQDQQSNVAMLIQQTLYVSTRLISVNIYAMRTHWLNNLPFLVCLIIALWRIFTFNPFIHISA